MIRENTRQINVGGVKIGGQNKVVIQSMTNVRNKDTDKAIKQILELEKEMARIKGGMNARRKHNRVLKLAKGYRGARSKQYRIEGCERHPLSRNADHFGRHREIYCARLP